LSGQRDEDLILGARVRERRTGRTGVVVDRTPEQIVVRPDGERGRLEVSKLNRWLKWELEPDACVVDYEPVAQLVEAFARDWSVRYPISERGSGYRPPRDPTDVEAVGAYEHLSFATGLPQYALRHLRSFPMDLRIADTLVAALNADTTMFHDGTLTPRPNPYAEPDRAAECCGGSLTGSALQDVA
jgi:hypothetical protein